MMLQEAGLIPDSTTSADTKWGLNSSRAALTTGSPASTTTNVQAQTIQRYSPLVETYTQRREELSRQTVCYGDSRQMPWYRQTVRPEDVLRAVGGTGRVVSCGESCIDVYLGQVGDNYFNDSCSHGYDQYFNVAVDMPEYIQSAHLMEVQWDDHIQVTIGDTVAYESPGFGNPPSRCELGRSWCMGEKTAGGSCGSTPSNDPGGPIDVTELFKVGGTISTNTRVWVGGGGEGFARVRILWNTPVAGQGDCISPNGVESGQ